MGSLVCILEVYFFMENEVGIDLVADWQKFLFTTNPHILFCNRFSTQVNFFFMKSFLLSLFLLALGFSGWAAGETEVSSDISSVTVFRQRAQVVRTAKTTVSKGENLLIFSGISQYILKNSLTVSGKGKGTIQSVSHRITYLNTTPKTARMISLEDSIEGLSAELGLLADDRFVNESEQQLILENRKLGGTNSGMNPAELEQVAEIYRKRLSRIRASLRKLAIAEKKLNESIGRIRQELSSITARRNQPTQQVIVAFQAEQSGSVQLEVKYLVNQANWSPFYDIRVENTRSTDPLQFHLKANVVNNTGIDWSDVDIKLSTTNNNVNNTRPSLTPWYVGVYYPSPAGNAYKSQVQRPAPSRRDAMSNTMDMDDAFGASLEQEELTVASDFTTVSEGELGLEFDIAIPYDIPADGKAHQVDVQLIEVPGTYRHFAVPKLDRDAFLVAEISQDLLRGKGNVYFEGTFVGETYVNTDNPRDSMLISLGRDPKVQIQRAQIKDFTSVKTIGTNIRKTYGYEITIRNNKSAKVKLLIEDQIPVPQDKDIEMSIEELSGGRVEEYSGRVIWDLELEPGETRQLTLRFEVKYPKNKQVSGL